VTQPGAYWGSDVPISMPEPPTGDIIIDMGATGFTLDGFAHNISPADLEDYMMPTFSPDGSIHE
jgi:hypothetical protein